MASASTTILSHPSEQKAKISPTNELESMRWCRIMIDFWKFASSMMPTNMHGLPTVKICVANHGMWETKSPDLMDMIGDAVVHAIGSTPRQPHPMEADREVYISPSEEPLTARTRARSRMRARSQSMRPTAARPVSRYRGSSDGRDAWDQPQRSMSRSRVSEPPLRQHHHQERSLDPSARQRERSKSEPRRRFDTSCMNKAPIGGGVVPTVGEPDLLGMTVETRHGDNMSHASRLSGTTLDHLALTDANQARRQYDVMKSVLEREKVGTKRSVYTRSSNEDTMTSRSRPSAENTVASFTTESRTPVHTIMEEGCDDDVRDYEAPVNFGGPRPPGSVIPAITRGVHMALTDDHGMNQSDSEVSAINKKVLRKRVEKIVLKQQDEGTGGRMKGSEQFAMDLQASTRASRQSETPLRGRNPAVGGPSTRERLISSIESSSELTPHGKKLQKIKRNFSVGAAARNERAAASLVLGDPTALKAPKSVEQDWRSDLFSKPVQDKSAPEPVAARPVSPKKARSDESILAHQQMVQNSWQQQQTKPREPLLAPEPPIHQYDEFEPSVRAAGSMPSRYGRYTPSEPSQEDSKPSVRQQQQAVLPKVIAPRDIANRAVSDTVSHLSSLVGGSVVSFAEQARKAYDPVKALPSSSPIPEIAPSPTKADVPSEALSHEINKVVESLVGKNQALPDDSRAQSNRAEDKALDRDETASKGYRSYFSNLLGMKTPWNSGDNKQDPDVLSKNTRTSSDVQAIESLSHRLQEAEKQTERLQQEVTVLKEALEDTASASQSWWPFSGLDQDRTVATSKYQTTKVPSMISEEGSSSSNEGGGNRDTRKSWRSCQVFEPFLRVCRYPFPGMNKTSGSMFNLNIFDSKEEQKKGQNLRKLKEENSLLRKEMKRMNKNRHNSVLNESEDNSGSMSSSISSYTESLLTKSTFPTRASQNQMVEPSTSFEATEMTYGPRCADMTESESLFSYTTKPVSVTGSKSSRRSEPTAKYSRNSEHLSKSSRRSELASKYSRKSDLVSKTSRRSGQTSKSGGRASEIASKSSRRSETTPKTSRKSEYTSRKPSRIPEEPTPESRILPPRAKLNAAEEELNQTVRSNQTARSNQTMRSTLSNRSNAVASVASSTRSQLSLRGKTPRVPTELLDEARRMRGSSSEKRSGSASLKSFRDKINELKYKAISDGVIQEGVN